MDRASLIFCGVSLAAFVAVGALAFPFAAITEGQAEKAKSVVEADTLGEMNLGDFGKVMVTDLVDYYIENPPAPVAAGAAQPKVRFEGC